MRVCLRIASIRRQLPPLTAPRRTAERTAASATDLSSSDTNATSLSKSVNTFNAARASASEGCGGIGGNTKLSCRRDDQVVLTYHGLDAKLYPTTIFASGWIHPTPANLLKVGRGEAAVVELSPPASIRQKRCV